MSVHLISHTHWDREWYLTYEQFRLRLVDLVDRLLEMLEADAEYRHFHLDGQTVVLDDYLELRPERRSELEAHVRSGRVLVGPWYVMPDEFLVSGESLVRNLALGHRVARGFGGAMPVGYLPDLFGHVAQMPQILRGFGLDNALLWRGFGGPRAEYWWDAPDGSRVLMLHLPSEGYCNATRVALAPERMVERAERAIATELARSRFGLALLMNGVDHVEPQAAIPGLVADLSATHAIRHSTLPAYVEAARCAAGGDGASLEVVRGELRAGEDYAPLLPGVLSARTYLKQANARVQNALEKHAEPLATFAWLLGERYPHAALNHAWRQLLQNHPHDSICGCSIDPVHEENMTRFARAAQVAAEIIGRSATAIARRVAPAADPDRLRLVVFNTTGEPRAGEVEATVDLPYESAEPGRVVDPEALDVPLRFWPPGSTIAAAFDAEGRGVPFQVLDEEDVVAFVMSRLETPWAVRARRIRLVVSVEALPALGYRAVDFEIGGARGPAAVSPSSLQCTPRSAENAFLRAAVNDDGTVDIEDRRTGVTYRRCGALLDEGDAGDEYNYSPPRADRRVGTEALRHVRVEALHQGPLRATFRVEAELPLPARLSGNRQSRSQEIVAVPVSFEISLGAGSPRVTWRVAVENRAEDHRLRLTLPTGLQRTDHVLADSAFAVVRRAARRDPIPSPKVEVAVNAGPMQSFVVPDGGGPRLAVFTVGLHEYEALEGDPDERIGITLLRCVGALSRDDLETRPHGHAGPGLATPGAQCPGRHEFTVAVVPLEGGEEPGAWYREASWLAAPPLAVVADSPSGTGPAVRSFVQVEQTSVRAVVSACKKAEERDAVVLRLFNPAAMPAAVRVPFPRQGDVWRLNLLEERQAVVETDLSVNSYEICSVELPGEMPG